MPDHRPSLRGRLVALDTRLRAPAATRTLAIVVAGLMGVQGAVVLDRTAGDAGTAPVAAADLGTEVEPAAAVADASASTTSSSTATGDTAAPASDLAAAPTADSTSDVRPASPSSTSSSAGTASSQQAPAQAASSDPARQRFASRFRAQEAAGQSASQPATTRWAVLIGVNEHSGRTRDNIGSRQDAEDIAAHLRSLGWRDDHIVLLTDGTATRENIVEAFRWLQRKTNEASVVVVHYSGHVKQWHGRDADGDGEVPDEAFWPSDNRFITDREVGDLLGRVKAARMWFNVGGCEAAGFNDWGITGPNRIATYSSAEHQKSYEDPSKNNSVWGFFLFQAGMIWGHGDANGDGNVTVEEAYRYATPRAHQRTRGQRSGAQTPEVSDRLKGEFDLRIPPPPKPRSSSPQPSEDDDRSCLLCPKSTATAGRLR